MGKEIIEFQMYDSIEDHDIDEEMSDEENVGTYIIRTFGRTSEGKSVYMKIINFTPHFYIKLPLQWTKMEATSKVDLMYKYLTSDLNKKIWNKFKSCLLSIDVVERMSAEGFTNEKKFLFGRLVFNNSIGMSKYRYLFEASLYIPNVTSQSTKFITFEANLQPMLRCFHIKKISGCAWITVAKYTLVELNKESYSDIEIIADWRDIEPIIKQQNAPLRIMSFDIECFSIDGSFPQAKRSSDSIIQIGSTYTYLGESTPYRQHIVCLNKTSDIDGIIVESFDTEKKMIQGWIDEIIRSDCDIITGYNIFFFDEAYIYERCEYLKILHLINKISKLKQYECKFRDFKLASSALGENRIRMFDTPGRIHIDLMKDVQKNHKLSCYKLDFVASNFIRDIIKDIKINKSEVILHCNNVNDILPGDFIHIEYALDFISDMIGDKYNIISVDPINNYIIINSNPDIINFINSDSYNTWKNPTDKKTKLWWCQAKDDIDIKQIFKSLNGTPDDRAIVAKYCIKDCKLVNLLIDKLNIITNNIEMSNVCYVPMSFLFTRGQTIKLFSLCLKAFRDEGYLFPVIKKPDEKQPSFEGAIVFEPESTIEYEGLAVNDYASLYPSTIIEMNMSIETKVKNEKYDSLPNIIYHNAKFRDNDGNIQYRRFAQKDKMGVIPSILSNLLKERAIVKKQMKNEKNAFTEKILDGKQLALKVTANSLYGALGADTSPICDRDIAACTTAIGRDRLILAKNFVENIVPGFFNGLKNAWLSKDTDKLNKLIALEVKNKDDKLVERLKKFITTDLLNFTFQPIVRYGDSVIGRTPLLLRNSLTGNIFIESINNLVSSDKFIIMDRELTDQNKESVELEFIESWTEKGWTKIDRVIRHKLDPSKKLLNITTHCGSVVVTDDHSLLNLDGNMVSPKDIKIGDKLLHSFPNINENITSYTFYNNTVLNLEVAQFLGMFMGDGSCGYYGNKATFAINNASAEVIKKYQDIANKNFIDFNWVRLETLKSSSVYKLVPVNKKQPNIKSYGNIKKFIIEMRKLMYTNDMQKKVPEFILNSSREIREAFFIGLYDADGYKTNGKIMGYDLYNQNNTCYINNVITDKIRCGFQIDQKGMIASQGIYTLGKSLGFEVSINNRKDKSNIYRIRFSSKMRKDPNIIKKIDTWNEYEEYVYDLTTSNHHFQAGVGSMIVHNTDSIFTCYRFRENVKKIKETSCLPLWKDIIHFSKILLSEFLQEDEREIWINLHDKYYKNITELSIPKGPEYIEPPSHWKIVRPVEERIEQFLLKYLEEGYLSWLWSLQDIFTKEYIDINVRNCVIENKLFNTGNNFIEMMRLVPIIFSPESKNNIIIKVQKFINSKLKEYIIQPYWDIKDNNKITRINMYKNGKMIIDRRCLVLTIELGILAGEFIKNHLPFPHDCKYEKTFWPFLILTKKRYVGNKYETNPDKYTQDYNGIVLKRRDNAPIVKEICGGVINCLINDKDPEKAKNFTIDCLRKIFNDKYNIKYFLTSKTLKMKESYVDWTRIAHVVLAERIAKRSPGTAPQSGDRIEFAAVQIENVTKTTLQGERIETPEFIKENNLKIDYDFYMTNQIMNPVLQFLSLVIPNAISIFDEFKSEKDKEKIKNKELKLKIREEKLKIKEEKLKLKEANKK
jgi:DNA polymerase elongation subunit (family B)